MDLDTTQEKGWYRQWNWKFFQIISDPTAISLPGVLKDCKKNMT